MSARVMMWKEARRDFICETFFVSFVVVVLFVHGNCMVILIIITNSEVIFHIACVRMYTHISKKPASNTHECERCGFVELPSECLYDYPAPLIVFSKSFMRFFMCSLFWWMAICKWKLFVSDVNRVGKITMWLSQSVLVFIVSKYKKLYARIFIIPPKNM